MNIMSKYELTFTEPLLGTKSGNKELSTEFIASKHPDGVQPDEQETIDEQLEKASTIFHKVNNRPFVWDYQFKGFFKEACLAMIETDALTKAELKAVRLTPYMYKRTIDKMIFVKPRRVFLQMPNGAAITENERPLRGQTARGERIALARSEEVPAGTRCSIEVISLNKKLPPYIEQWLVYGELFGFGQWRSAGYGRFEYKKLDNSKGVAQ
jgi:hypothetical protein